MLKILNFKQIKAQRIGSEWLYDASLDSECQNLQQKTLPNIWRSKNGGGFGINKPEIHPRVRYE